MAQFEDEGLFEEEISLEEETALVNREISIGQNSSRGGPKISKSLANQFQGSKRLSVVPCNVPGSSVGADIITVTSDREKS